MTTTTDGTLATGREQRAEALVSAAHELFAREGYDRTSLDDLAQRAGLDPAEARELFPDKQAVLAALIERSVRIAGVLGPDVALGVDEDLPARLARTYLTLWEPKDGEESPMVRLYRIALASPEASAVLRERVTGALNSQVNGELPSGDAALRTAAFGTHVGGLAVWRHLVGIGPLAQAPLSELLELVTPSLRRELLAG